MAKDDKLLPRNMTNQPAFGRGHFYVQPAAGATLKMIQNKDYWAHVASGVPVDSLIEVYPQDKSFDALVRVVGKGPQYLDVKLIYGVEHGKYDEKKARKVEEDAVQADLDAVEEFRYESGNGPRSTIDAAGYTISFVPKQRWRVVDRDGAVVSKDNQTRADAEAALAEHKRLKAEAPEEDAVAVNAERARAARADKGPAPKPERRGPGRPRREPRDPDPVSVNAERARDARADKGPATEADSFNTPIKKVF